METSGGERTRGMALVGGAALIWGTIGIAVSLLYGVAGTNSFSVGLLRLLVAAPVLLLMSRLLVGPEFWRVQRSHLGVLAMVGLAIAGYQLAYFAAIPLLGVAAAVMLNICSAPIFTAVLAGLFLNERLAWRTWTAMAGAIAGTALLVGGAPQAEGAALWSGAALALTAGLCYSLIGLGSKLLAPHYHPIQPVALSFSLGALLLVAPALAGGLVLRYPPGGWLLIFYLGLVPTAMAYVLYQRGLRGIPATVASILTLLEPLCSTLLAVLLLGERLSGVGALGAGLLLASMLLLTVRGRTRAEAQAKPA